MKRKKIVVMLLVVSMSLCACSGGKDHSRNNVTVTTSLAGQPALVGNIPCTFPLVDQETTLNIFIKGYGDVKQEDVYVWQKYEQMTGVKVNWIDCESSETVENALFNKNSLDIMLKCATSANAVRKYGESGYVYDLMKDDMLETYAPNCWAYLTAHPDALAGTMNPDGSIYALPQINAGPELRVARKIFINKNWLANVHMDVPTTTEELYQILKAFKEQDANGNGDPDDEIPLCTQDWASIQQALYGAYGLGNRGFHNFIVDYDENNQKVRLIYDCDDYKLFLQYFNQLYTEGLIDPNIFSVSMEQWLNNASNDCIGCFANTNLATLPSDVADNWVAVEEALEGPTGYKMWTAIRANFHSSGAAMIPATCTCPELVLKWLDYFWTDEGTLFYHMGVEGETFVANKDHTYSYSPEIYNEIAEKKSFDDVIATYTPYPAGHNPTVEIAPYFMGGEMADVPASAARKLFEYGPKEYWPSFTFTSEEYEKISVIEGDIKKYCNATRCDFITGAKSFDEWDEYKSHVESLGKAQMLEIYQAAYERYKKLTSEY